MLSVQSKSIHNFAAWIPNNVKTGIIHFPKVGRYRLLEFSGRVYPVLQYCKVPEVSESDFPL